MDPSPINSQLIQEMVARELAKPQQAVQKPLDLGLGGGYTPTTISPEKLHTLGGIADAAGTFFGLSHKAGGEANPMLKQASPMQAGLGLVGQLAATKGLTHLVRKVSPGLADALAANLGAQQMSLGADWGSALAGHPVTQAGNDVYAQKLLMRNSNGR